VVRWGLEDLVGPQYPWGPEDLEDQEGLEDLGDRLCLWQEGQDQGDQWAPVDPWGQEDQWAPAGQWDQEDQEAKWDLEDLEGLWGQGVLEGPQGNPE